MILLVFAAVGCLIGLIVPVQRSPINHAPIRFLFLPVLSYGVKALSAALFPPQQFALGVCILQYALLFFFLFANIKRFPRSISLAALGTLMNFLVIAFNEGCMPVSKGLLLHDSRSLERLISDQIYAYRLAGPETKLAFFGDVLPLKWFQSLIGFASAGDCLMGLGTGLLCLFLVLRFRADRKLSASAGKDHHFFPRP